MSKVIVTALSIIVFRVLIIIIVHKLMFIVFFNLLMRIEKKGEKNEEKAKISILVRIK